MTTESKMFPATGLLMINVHYTGGFVPNPLEKDAMMYIAEEKGTFLAVFIENCLSVCAINTDLGTDSLLKSIKLTEEHKNLPPDLHSCKT